MRSKKILIPAFVVVVAVQLYVPARMIIDREEILQNGITYKFKTAPVDPYDPFRGKYINLRFEQDVVKIKRESEWLPGESLFAVLAEDEHGMAMIDSISREKPRNIHNFIQVKAGYVLFNDSTLLHIDYPFTRFYMEESKAFEAETAYAESNRDTTSVTYALVKVKDGDAVIQDVLIDGESITDIVRRRQRNRNE